jgi:phosphatidylserine/phosphatidylglycerophosphate/cardiolipin synthase-like enzyme
MNFNRDGSVRNPKCWHWRLALSFGCGFILLGTTASRALSTAVYFSPNGGAANALIREIGAAKIEILVQAYSFTSIPIADALIRSKNSGVNVMVILDKRTIKERYSCVPILQKAHIPIYVDYLVSIAHSKDMILDDKDVVTGSFNFTESAEKRNEENLLIIQDDVPLALTYADNFRVRLKLSRCLSN